MSLRADYTVLLNKAKDYCRHFLTSIFAISLCQLLTSLFWSALTSSSDYELTVMFCSLGWSCNPSIVLTAGDLGLTACCLSPHSLPTLLFSLFQYRQTPHKLKEDRKKINHVCFLGKHTTQGLKYQKAARIFSFLPSTLLIPMSRKQRGRCTLIPMITWKWETRYEHKDNRTSNNPHSDH